jgi:ABC-type multidrug transport system fused ATPase/permease subunit
MVGLAVLTFLTRSFMSLLTGIVSNNVTLNFRKELYGSILRKNIGFFDEREHVPTVLTSMMADQTTKLNSAGANGILPMIVFVFQLICICAFSFYYQW